ncbi:MAG: hypothetical protein M1352_01000 [Patescibacteria group bacterium]|nr:hypothetical protein [Patescibacteria group bacterium]
MQIQAEPQQALRVINDAKSLALITGWEPSVDSVAAMLAFYHLFKGFKKIRAVVPEKVPEACYPLPESSVITHDLGPKKFAINLDTNGVQLEKVSYLLEGRTFRLILHPQTRSFEAERVSYEYLGYNYDLFIFFGLPKLSEVAPLFNYDLSEIYRNSSLNFDVRLENELFASINLVDTSLSTVCELLFKMINFWQLKLSREVSRCLLEGLTAEAPSPVGHDSPILSDLEKSPTSL